MTHFLNCAVLHFDDEVLSFSGASIHEVVDAAVSVELDLKQNLVDIGVELSEEKEQIFAASDEVAASFWQADREEGCHG